MDNLITLKVPGSDVEFAGPPGLPASGGELNNVILWVFVVLLLGATILALGYLVFGGVMWITSEGDKQKVESARKTITYALIGLILAFLSIAIVNFIGQLTRDPANPDIPSGGFLNQIL